jgi:hypothetical protein
LPQKILKRKGNSLILRGMGPNPAIVLQGHIILMYETVARIVRTGRSSAERAKRELEEIIAWARLIRLNDERPGVDIEGYVKILVKKDVVQQLPKAQFISSKVRDALDDIKITIQRIKR